MGCDFLSAINILLPPYVENHLTDDITVAESTGLVGLLCDMQDLIGRRARPPSLGELRDLLKSYGTCSRVSKKIGCCCGVQTAVGSVCK